MGLVVIMRGVPGSGKSTAATQIKEHAIKTMKVSATICSNDDYPGYYDNTEKSYDWTPAKAKAARRFCQERFDKALADGVELIIVDNCHLTHKSYAYFRQKAEAAGYQISFNTFVPTYNVEYINVCAARNKHKVTAKMIINMMKSWES